MSEERNIIDAIGKLITSRGNEIEWITINQLATLENTHQLFSKDRIEEIVGNTYYEVRSSLNELYIKLRGYEMLYAVKFIDDFVSQLRHAITTAEAIDDGTEHSRYISPEEFDVVIRTHPWIVIPFAFRFYLTFEAKQNKKPAKA